MREEKVPECDWGVRRFVATTVRVRAIQSKEKRKKEEKKRR